MDSQNSFASAPSQPVVSDLYVVTAISNPQRYTSRYALYEHFARHMRDSGAQLVTVELALGDRAFAVTQAGHPFHVQLRTRDELWHKENLLNLGISRLPPNWKYVAWIDADVHFTRPDWVQETVARLQHYAALQLFSEAQDLGPNYEVINHRRSFFYTYRETGRLPGAGYPRYDKSQFATGLAWAMRRESFNDVGGLMDWAICGGGDWFMANALVGRVEKSVRAGAIGGHYLYWLKQWQQRADRFVKGNVGYLPGLLLHNWHGKKIQRKYQSRWKILRDHQFDPSQDLKRDWQGLWQWAHYDTPRLRALRDGIRNYLASRNEDSIDVT